MEHRILVMDGVSLPYQLTRKKVKNINLRVKMDGTVSVSAHPNVSLEVIESFLKSKWNMIWDFKEKAEKKIEKTEGTSIVYLLGKALELQIEQGELEGVVVEGNILRLITRKPEHAKRNERMLEEYYLRLCEKVFLEIIQEIYPFFKSLGICFPTWDIKKWKSRWGVCIPSEKKIVLNRYLIHKDRRCIEYVVLHEFAHFLVPNHSKDFYQLVEKFMPDYKERRNLLKL